MSKFKADLLNENFDLFFASLASQMTEAQKGCLPQELQFKLFKQNGFFNAEGPGKLSFINKLFILWKALRRRCYIIVEDEEGMNYEQFVEFKKEEKKRDYSMKSAEKSDDQGMFFLANKEFCDSLAYLSQLSASPAYNYLLKTKNASIVPQQSISDFEAWKRQMNYIMKMLVCYESQKRRWDMVTNINMHEWLVLIYIYSGEEVQSALIYKEVYKYAFHGSPTKIKTAFGTLQSKGYIEKIGFKKGAKIKITSIGKDMVNQVMKKYVLSC